MNIPGVCCFDRSMYSVSLSFLCYVCVEWTARSTLAHSCSTCIGEVSFFLLCARKRRVLRVVYIYIYWDVEVTALSNALR